MYIPPGEGGGFLYKARYLILQIDQHQVEKFNEILLLRLRGYYNLQQLQAFVIASFCFVKKRGGRRWGGGVEEEFLVLRWLCDV